MAGRRGMLIEMTDTLGEACDIREILAAIPEKLRKSIPWFIMFIAQIICHGFLLKYTRSINQELLISTLIFWSEVLKFFICMTFMLNKTGDFKVLADQIKATILHRPWRLSATLIPAFVYTIQNNFQYMAVLSLDLGTFQVINHLKILPTAHFSRMFMQKKIQKKQWAAISMLIIAIFLLQGNPSQFFLLQSSMKVGPTLRTTPLTDSAYQSHLTRGLGLMAAFFCAIFSGLCGAYTEKLSKHRQRRDLHFWTYHAEISFFGAMFSSFFMMVNDRQIIQEYGLFNGFTPLVWFVIVLNAMGGVITTIIVHRFDCIVKCLLVAVAIVIQYLTIHFLVGSSVSIFAILGLLTVPLSIQMYVGDTKDAHLHAV